jgi:hypothetical protein
METAIVKGEIAPIARELKIPPVPDDRDTIIQSCYELLCSGRPLAEVLDEAKRLSDLSKRTKPDTTGEPCNAGIADRPDAAASHRSTRSDSEVAHLPEPMSSSIINQAQRSSGALTPYSFLWRLRSVRANMIVLTIVLMLASAFTYVEFSKVNQNIQYVQLQSMRDESRVISQSLLPLLKNAAIDDLPKLGSQLERFAGRATTIKLLLAPADGDGDKFYYAGSWPRSDLEAERRILAQQGVLDRLSETCQRETPVSLIYDRPTGSTEIIAVTPLSTSIGCWAVVTTFSADAFPGTRLGQR